ncbi:MAG: cardiolipin synthase B [Gemmatimonadetes bacterium]|nr:cardiolipin synthase B [Gemmatimonadota bacterium]
MAHHRRSVVITVLVVALAALAYLNLAPPRRKLTDPITSHYAVADSQFVRTMGSLLGPGILPGNQVTPLRNGAEIFPAMLAAIRSARETITFETYIYWSGQIGKAFTDALSERARAGVQVHVLLDWVGAGRMDDTLLTEMEAAGVEVEKYHPLRWYTLDRLNHRTHRKLLVVDGRVGFTGGVGIADVWQGHAEDSAHWRDTHFRVEGPVVAQLQAAFLDNWLESHATLLHDEGYFPPLAPGGTMPAQVFKSSPEEGSGSARLMYLLSIAAARRTLRIASAYFVPDDLSVQELVAARRRGVAVEIIVPGPYTDADVVRHASRGRWGDLLAAGVRIWEYQPTMYHTKMMIVDDAWVSVGSTNFDNRSFRLNDEANLNVMDSALAAGLVRDFEEDKGRSREVTRAAWEARPFLTKAREWAAGLLRSQL